MKINAKVEKAFNKQINNELYSGYMYLSMAAYFEDQNLPGMAKWMKKQGEEEYGHAMKFYAHINERQGKAVMEAIAKPPTTWKSPLDVFEAAFKHEQKVTKMIDDLVELSSKVKDHAAHVFLHWFVNEQVEEEATADEIVQKLKMVGSAKHALLMLDHELGRRE